MSLVWCSPQNVDRIVTIYRACLRTNRQFVVDRATADLLRTTIAPVPVPREVWEGIRVFVPATERRQSRRSQTPATRDEEGPPAITPGSLAEVAGRSVVLFRPGMMTDLEQSSCLVNARLIFSMWSGYLEYENSNPVLEWLDRHNIPLDQFHTAGHAAIIELVELRRAFAAAPVVPIGRHPERFGVLFGKVQHRAVGERSCFRQTAQPRRDPAAVLLRELLGLADAAARRHGEDDLASRRVNAQRIAAGLAVAADAHRIDRLIEDDLDRLRFARTAIKQGAQRHH